MKKLIFTITVGPYHSAMGAITHPTLRAYADRIGADFHVIGERKIAHSSLCWEKFQAWDFFADYDRILYFDTDIIVRGDTPDLFGIVPPERVGMFNESLFPDRGPGILLDVSREYGVSLEGWNGAYFNAGMFLASRVHQRLFRKPEKEYNHFYDQSYFNLALIREKIPMFELDYRFNRMAGMDRFVQDHRLDAYVVHYAGYEDPDPNRVLAFISNDVEQWRKNGLL